MLVEFQDSYNTCRWVAFILTPSIRANGHAGVKDQGAYKISNCRVG